MEQQPQEEPNPLMRKKKTPEELAAEAEQEDLDDFTSKYHINFIIIVSFIHIIYRIISALKFPEYYY